jgi:hypothetical protein
MSHKPKPPETGTRDALEKMHGIVLTEKRRKPSRKQIPLLLDAIEILIVLLERQALR